MPSNEGSPLVVGAAGVVEDERVIFGSSVMSSGMFEGNRVGRVAFSDINIDVLDVISVEVETLKLGSCVAFKIGSSVKEISSDEVTLHSVLKFVSFLDATVTSSVVSSETFSSLMLSVVSVTFS